MNGKFAFIGAGALTTAMVECLTVYYGGSDNVEFYLYDKFPEQYRKFFGKKFIAADSCAQAVNACDYIVLSVKPQNLAEVLEEIKATAQTHKKTFILPAAGVEMSTVTNVLGDVAVIRIMPNMPLRIGYGVTALCRNQFVGESQYYSVCAIFAACGHAFELPESGMNAVIAATSSAPAYVYLFIKAMVDGAEALGLDPATMLEPVCRTVIGAAQMLIHSKKTPAELVSMVATKGGTTEQAVSVLETRDFHNAIIDAMAACTNRAEELAEIEKNRMEAVRPTSEE